MTIGKITHIVTLKNRKKDLATDSIILIGIKNERRLRKCMYLPLQ
jgi:hypothetical protein